MTPKQTAHEPVDESPRKTAVSEPTTTHAEWGAGEPHLVITREGLHETFALTADVTAIGSGAECALQLSGLDVLHAEITHRDDDEYVLILHGDAAETSGSPTGDVSVHAHGQVLRSGAQFVLGPWRFVYMRAEYADHGRPFGGREGGEGTVQPRQPERPDYSADSDGDGDGDRRPEERDAFADLPAGRQDVAPGDYHAQGDPGETDPDSGLPDPGERGLR